MKNLKITSLLHGIEGVRVLCPAGYSLEDIEISAVTADSRNAEKDAMFVAVTGERVDGHDFIFQAMEKGIKAAVVEREKVAPPLLAELYDANVCVIEAADSTQAYAAVAANFFGRPAEELVLAGITGTNGKTTVTYLVEHILQQQGMGVGVIGTINSRYTISKEQKILATRLTTPEPMVLQSVLREMADAGVTHMIMEVSSHALAQRRVGTLQYQVAAFTNLSRDHLDYHHDMESYFEAKKQLFSDYLKTEATVVLPEINRDAGDVSHLLQLHRLCEERGDEIILWGSGEDADIRSKKCKQYLDKTDIELQIRGQEYLLRTPLVGRFNVENVMTAMGICLAMGLEIEAIISALSSASCAPGRMQRITTGAMWDVKGPTVLVDYAHTPDALEKVLLAAKELPHKTLVSVFGCGGDRDKGKRPEMGAIGVRLSDVTIITDDNPRSEDPDEIIENILAGIEQKNPIVRNKKWLACRSPGERGCVVIRSRREAIETALKSAGPDDLVVIAGKGHEPYQLTSAGTSYFNDTKKAQDILFSWTSDLVAQATGGYLVGRNGSQLLGKITTDSREVTTQGVFIALKGEKHDAHAFVKQAVENGCCCLVVERTVEVSDPNISQVIVTDTTSALGNLAAFRRKCVSELSDPIVVGLTGSCGKTTVKEMVATIFEKNWPEGSKFPVGAVLKTKGNFNNLIGLPLSLLPVGIEHRAAVLEMGMNMKGEIARLGEIADPDISCITNIHGAHLEGLGSIDGVAQAKEELFQATRESGTLIVNLDDPKIRSLSKKYHQRKITFSVERQPGEGTTLAGSGDPANLWASNVRPVGLGETRFTVHHGSGQKHVHLHIAGAHNVSNALCAAAIGVAAGVDLATIAEGLEAFRPPDKRMEMLVTKAGFNVLNDSYNANPGSMAAGLKTLTGIGVGKKIAVLGDMLELGASSDKAHYDIGKLVAALVVDEIAVTGEFRKQVEQGALDSGFAPDSIHCYSTKEQIVSWLKQMVDDKHLGEKDLVLVKASRGCQFETIVAELVE